MPSSLDRIPRWALYAFVVALPLHNLVMSALWNVGVRDFALDVVSAWKELLLALALAVLVWRARGMPFRPVLTDWLALAYTGFVVLYALIPQDWLGGDASARSVLYALRHDLTPVAAYALGRGLTLGEAERQRLNYLILGIAAVVAAWGLVDIYTISLQTWRDSGVPGWFREQLGLEYEGLSGLPENWVYNPGDERPLRRLVSTFLSPLATAYLLLVAMLSRRRPGATAAGSRSSPRCSPPASSSPSRAPRSPRSRSGSSCSPTRCGRGGPSRRRSCSSPPASSSRAAYEDIAPETRFTPAELEIQRAGGAEEPTSGDPTSLDEASVDSHLDNLRDGIETVLRHPWGYGLGNAGVTAKRTDTEIKAGESTYTELGVELGLLGMLAFVAWNVSLLLGLVRRAPWLGASLAAVLGLAIQTDVVGVHWLAFVLYALAGERT